MNTKQIKHIKDGFILEDTEENKDIVPSEFKMLMDPANVLALIPKTSKSYKVLSGIGYKIADKIPKIERKEYQFCRFSKEYITYILKTLLASDNEDFESITIGIREGFPLIMENKDIGFILAPRYNNDNGTWHDSKIEKVMVLE